VRAATSTLELAMVKLVCVGWSAFVCSAQLEIGGDFYGALLRTGDGVKALGDVPLCGLHVRHTLPQPYSDSNGKGSFPTSG
jgi:hypothetical protein